MVLDRMLSAGNRLICKQIGMGGRGANKSKIIWSLVVPHGNKILYGVISGLFILHDDGRAGHFPILNGGVEADLPSRSLQNLIKMNPVQG